MDFKISKMSIEDLKSIKNILASDFYNFLLIIIASLSPL